MQRDKQTKETDKTTLHYIFDVGAGLCAVTHSLSVLERCFVLSGELDSYLVIVTRPKIKS